ncbi:MAG TPA: adenosine deaminase [Candidatus Binatus sp.]|jgi:aminodeoxyfutalosine deaminase|nr:adenosine deaminase [Candidatus Binatus sp.]
MNSSLLPARIASLPKAELHLHLEGSIQPATVCALTAQHNIELTEDEVRQRYTYRDFTGFIDAFKWVTSFLREPRDYGLIATDLGEHLLTQGVVYAEVTLSIGVMLLRKQQPEANFEAILRATEPFEKQGLRLNWVFDAARQFGAEAAMDVVRAANRCQSKTIVAFGIGGDEMSVATQEFRPVYEQAANNGLHLLMHAGEVGGPEKIREAVELLNVERIGHGIAAAQDPALMDLLVDRRIPLEVCPQSNIRTGALAKQLRLPDATLAEHPLPRLWRHGIAIVLSTDDPAMFHTTLRAEYENAARMGLNETELVQLVNMSFEHAFLSENEKLSLRKDRNY